MSGPAREARGVLFDAAGTLIDPREPVGDTYARHAAAQGVALPGWRLEDAFHRVLARAEPPALRGLGPEEAATGERRYWDGIVRSTFLAADSTVRFPDPEALARDLFAHFAAASAWSLRPAAGACLEALRRQGWRLGVASNFDHRLPGILQEIGILDYFDSITIPSGCGHRKPERAFFHAALAALGTRAARTVHVGDDPERDAGAARRAGLDALAVDAIPDGLAGLPATLEALATLGVPKEVSPPHE